MNYAEAEKTINLKFLLFFVLKRWKKIFIFLMIGILLGSGFALIRGKKTVDDLDMDNLNMEQIVQYEHFSQLYQLQLEKEASSVILRMDPNAVYSASRVFYITVPAEKAELFRQKYSLMISDTDVLQKLIDVSGLECDERAIKEIVSVSASTIMSSTLWGQLGFIPAYVKVTLSVVAPSEETEKALLNALDEQLMIMNERFAEIYEGFACEMLADSRQFGFDVTVGSAQASAADLMKDYASELVKLEEEMSDDDLFYYSQVHAPEEKLDEEKELISKIKRVIKYAIMFGALFCVLTVGWYGIQFLLDDHIKTAHEVREYGLYTIACLESGETKKTLIDKLFAGDNLPANSKEYLLNALKALCHGNMVLCGDIHDGETAETMNWLASQMDELCVTDRLACDEKGLLTAKESEGAILFVRLWKTTTFDLKRELYVLRQIDKPVKGVVVLRG